MRKNNLLKSASLFMILLVLFLPVSFAQSLNNQTASSKSISLDAVVPQFAKIKYVDITGTTAPDAKIEYYIGPTKVKVGRSKIDGSFSAKRVPLIKQGENDLLIKVIVGDASVQKSYSVYLDANPPVLTISDIPEFTTQSSLKISGDVSEPVNVKYASYSKKEDEPPVIVAGLEVRDVEKNQVALAWTPSDDEDLLEYAVYRDGVRIGVSRTAVFLDNTVASGKEYTYQVSAVDSSCNEGPLSASKKAETKSGGDDEEQETVVDLSCSPDFKIISTAVPFEITVPLSAGRNIVEIIAEDNAGNVDKVVKEVNLDVGPPQFLSANADSIGTTYIPEVDIKGQLSEKGTVFVYINGESSPSYYGLTDAEGNFEIPIKLRQDFRVESGSAAELDTGVGWENKIKLKAVDLAGQEAWYPGASKNAVVVWAICGYGSWLDFDIEEVSPSMLTPRLLMQGVQQIGIPFTLTYAGGQDDAEIAGLVNAIPVRLSPDLNEFFDNDKIAVPQVWLQKRQDQKVWDGFIQLNFNTWPKDQLDLGSNDTDAAVEKAISEWRRGEYIEPGIAGRGVYLKPGCIDPAFGCAKLYLELDIPLKEKVRIFDPQTQQERFEWKSVRQRNCVPLTMSIDQVIPPDVIRKNSLEATSNFFSEAIELIDKVLDPLTTFTENLMYLCMSSAAALFLAGISKRVLCSSLVLKDGVDSDLAEAGICAIAYENEDSKKSSCEKCQWAAKTYKNIVEDLYQPICDRITCPSAPTVQKFILDKKGTPKDITNKIPNTPAKEGGLTPRQKAILEWGVNGKVYSGNGCGFSDVLSLGYTVEKQAVRERGQRGEGEPCTDDSTCMQGLYCNPFNGLCTARSGPEKTPLHSVSEGGSCESDSDCMSGLTCNVFNKCSKPIAETTAGSKNVGETCFTDADCAGGLKCSAFTGECYEPAPSLADVGQECGEDKDCMPGLICDDFLKTCKSGSRLTGGVSVDVSSAFATGSAVAGAAGQSTTTTTSSSSSSSSSAGSYSSDTICGFKLSELGIAGNQIGVLELYDAYKGNDAWSEVKKLCTNSSLHPACPLCCGIDYMWQWNSACGIGNFLGTTQVVDLDTFDELKESTKLAAEKAGRGDEFSKPNILNFLSGFCTSGGNPTPDVIRTGLNFNPKIDEAEENAMQVFIFPDSTKKGDSFKYKVFRGYLAKTFVIDNAIKNENKVFKDTERYKFSSTIEAIKDTELTQFFSKTGNEAAQKKGFVSALCQNMGSSKLEGKKSCSAVANEIYDKVKSHVGSVDEEYIVKPNSGIINSIRCICFPALIAYLKQWRSISVAIKNCVDMIRLTGDGSEGQCRSLLSTYVCDLLWEIISCFANKWGSPSGKRLSADAGIGSVIGILTGAGTDLANEVEGRYGETAAFNAMFNEKEMVHGLCLLAFGMEWNVDASVMVQQSVESVPVETTVLGPTPCQSRFIAWNPLTSPRGLTTWEYHFGLMASAGADITPRVKLKCSSGFDCSEDDGFVGGECDCNRVGEKEITINPVCTPAWKNSIKKDELVSLDCTYTVQQSKYRYDTLIFEYDWYDEGTKQRITKSSDCSLNAVGSDPPSFCRFDPLTASFRCRFGESPSGIRLDSITPEYDCQASKTDSTKVFAVDENPEFELLVSQMMPEEQSEINQGIKYLGYKITNSNGAVVAEINPDTDPFTVQLKTDGTYKQIVEIPNDGNWKKFFDLTGSKTLPVSVWSSDVALSNKISANPAKYIDNINIAYTVDNKVTPVADKFVVDIQGDDLEVYVYRGKADAYLTDVNYKIFDGKNKVKDGETYKIVYTKDDSSGKTHVYDVSFKLVDTDLFKSDRVQYLLDYSKGTPSKDPCVSGEPVSWNVEFTSYDADKYGRVTSQVSVDPKTGEKQSKSALFKMSCFKKDDLLCAGDIVPTGISAEKIMLSVDLVPSGEGIVLDAPLYFDNYDPAQGGLVWASFYNSEDKNNKPSPGETGALRLRLENTAGIDFKDLRVHLTGPAGVKIQHYDSINKKLGDAYSDMFTLKASGDEREKTFGYIITIPAGYSDSELPLRLGVVQTPGPMVLNFNLDAGGQNIILDPYLYFDHYDPAQGGAVWASLYESEDENNVPSWEEKGIVRFRIENKGTDVSEGVTAELIAPDGIRVQYYNPDTGRLSNTVSESFVLDTVGDNKEKTLAYLVEFPEASINREFDFTLKLNNLQSVGSGPYLQTASGVSCSEITSCLDYNQQDCAANICSVGLPLGCVYDSVNSICRSSGETSS